MYKEGSDCGEGCMWCRRGRTVVTMEPGCLNRHPDCGLSYTVSRVGSVTPLGRRMVGLRSNRTHLRTHTGGKEDRVHSIALGRIQQECHLVYDDEYCRDI
jgi:hypothetical protein